LFIQQALGQHLYSRIIFSQVLIWPDFNAPGRVISAYLAFRLTENLRWQPLCRTKSAKITFKQSIPNLNK
jgi:hypothetical protein